MEWELGKESSTLQNQGVRIRDVCIHSKRTDRSTPIHALSGGALLRLSNPRVGRLAARVFLLSLCPSHCVLLRVRHERVRVPPMAPKASR